MNNPDIKTVIDFVRGQMDGGAVPPQGSNAEQELSTAVGNLHRHNSPREQEFLGLALLDAVIDRMRGNIAAAQALQRFIRRDI
ncbi:MAG: hypothetical protein WAU15_09200 [Nitrosomonas sp.]